MLYTAKRKTRAQIHNGEYIYSVRRIIGKAAEALKVIPKSSLIYRHETSNVVFTLRQWNTVRNILPWPGILNPQAQLCPTKNFLADRLLLHTSKVQNLVTMNFIMGAQIALQKYTAFQILTGKQQISHSKAWDHPKKLTKKIRNNKNKFIWWATITMHGTWHDGRNKITLQIETTADSEWNKVSCDQIGHHQSWWKVHGQIITRKAQSFCSEQR